MLLIIWDLMTIEFCVTVFLAIIFGIWVAYYVPRARSLKKKHVLITGGSSGIGKHIAIEAVKKGASVSLLARDALRLEEARTEILKYLVNPSEQKVACISVDIGGSYELVEKAVIQAAEELGPIFILVNCAGYARANRFEDMSLKEIKQLMTVNYFGTTQVTHAVISTLKSQREGGILFVSSQAGLCGVYGFAAYSASKFALRGLAESLAMELKPYNVTVTIGYPPDTDTPGFARENEDKPEETRLISEAAGLFSPETVAKTLLNHTLQGKFSSTVGFEGFVQSTLCIGMAPVTSAFEIVVQVLTMGLFRLISVFYLWKFNKIIKNCMEVRNQRKRSE